MNDDAIQDLKQFISTTISQQISDLATKEDISKLKSDISKLEADISNLDKNLSSKIDDLSNSVSEALESTNETTGEQLRDHNQRIIKLEKKVSLNII